MSINFIIFPLIILLGLFLGAADSARNRKTFIILVSFILLLETSLRSLSVGSDTMNYYDIYNDVQAKSWGMIWDEFIGRYFYNTNESDIGYWIFQKMISMVAINWQMFVFIANLFFFVPLGRLMYRYSSSMTELVFAYILYVAMFHIISLSGGRQLYAIGLSIMAYMSMTERKYKMALLYIFLGMFIHMTALLFLLPLLLSRINPKYLKTIHLFSFAMVPVVLIFTNQIIVLMGSSIGVDKYANYGMSEVQGGATTFMSLLLLVSLFCYLTIKKTELQNSRALANIYLMLPLFTFFGPLIYSNGSMIRISMYFHLYIMLLIPLAVNRYTKGFPRTVTYSILIVAVMVLALKDGGLIYYFYWEEPHLLYNLG